MWLLCPETPGQRHLSERSHESVTDSGLIHDYFGIDVEAIWDTVHKNIPELRKHIEQLLADEQK
ncbi:MAG: HepT-like ribonuclease domain-containing protein [Geobacteraceae bacterium]